MTQEGEQGYYMFNNIDFDEFKHNDFSENITHTITGAGFTRSGDKNKFILGVMLTMAQAFILGKYPNDLYYKFHSILTVFMIFQKTLYYKSRGWHYYMTDLCYSVNFLCIVYLIWFPKNDIMFKVVFLYANGTLPIAVYLFRNSYVFHNFDMLSSCAIHMYPMIAIFNLKWVTMPYEASLPEAERKFVTLDEDFDPLKFFAFPAAFYGAWVLFYALTQGVICKGNIDRNKYETLFKSSFQTIGFVKKLTI